jgi:DNA-binding CsgD family transcriptional regulator
MVTHLVLWGTYAHGADYFGETRSQVIHAVMPRDWDLFTETMAHAQLGWSEAATAEQFAGMLRDRVPSALLGSFDAAAHEIDVRALLGDVRAPALVMHRSEVCHPEVAIARQLAAGLPRGSLALLEGSSIAPFVGDVDAAIASIEGFFDRPDPGVSREGAGENRTTETPPIEPLSARERQVLQLLALGLRNDEIAVELVVAPGTAKTHTSSIYRKLDVTSRTKAVARARQLGLLGDA